MMPRTWLLVGLGAAALGAAYYVLKVKPKRDAEGAREAKASADMIRRVASQGAARRVSDVIAQGPKAGVIQGPAGFAAQLQARYQA